MIQNEQSFLVYSAVYKYVTLTHFTLLVHKCAHISLALIF